MTQAVSTTMRRVLLRFGAPIVRHVASGRGPLGNRWRMGAWVAVSAAATATVAALSAADEPTAAAADAAQDPAEATGNDAPAPEAPYYDFVLVGGGLAAYTALTEIMRAHRERPDGGAAPRVLLIGDEARAPYLRPPLSKAVWSPDAVFSNGDVSFPAADGGAFLLCPRFVPRANGRAQK